MMRWRRRVALGLLVGAAVAGGAPVRGVEERDPNEPPPPPIVKVNPKDGAEMVLVPAGAYVADNMHLKTPVKRRLGSYFIYRDLVSAAQYRRFCAATGRTMPPQPEWKGGGLAGIIPKRWQDGEATAPVMGVTWDDAQAYCRWAGVSLTTDAQWEKAAWGTHGSEEVIESPCGVRDLRVVARQWCEYNAEDRSTSEFITNQAGSEWHSIRGAYGPFDPNPWEHSSATRGIHGHSFRGATDP